MSWWLQWKPVCAPQGWLGHCFLSITEFVHSGGLAAGCLPGLAECDPASVLAKPAVGIWPTYALSACRYYPLGL